MLAKKEITINGEKWIADFETGTVYKNVTMIPNGTGLLPMSGRYGDYPFKVFRNALYFETGNNFYKIIGDEVLEVNEEEYKEIKNYRILKKNDPSTLRIVSTHVISIVIADIMDKKFNLRISVPVENSNIVNIFSKNFTPEIKSHIKRIATGVIAMLPIQVNRKTMKQQIRDIYKNIVQEDEDFFNVLIDNIYLNDKQKFDYLSEDIIKSRNSRKKITEDITEDSQLSQEEIVEQKGKLK